MTKGKLLVIFLLFPLVFNDGVLALTCKDATDKDETCDEAGLNGLATIPIPEKGKLKMGCGYEFLPGGVILKGCQAIRPSPDNNGEADTSKSICSPSSELGKSDCLCFSDGCNAKEITPPTSSPSTVPCAEKVVDKDKKESGSEGVPGTSITPAFIMAGILTAVYFQK